MINIIKYTKNIKVNKTLLCLKNMCDLRKMICDLDFGSLGWCALNLNFKLCDVGLITHNTSLLTQGVSWLVTHTYTNVYTLTLFAAQNKSNLNVVHVSYLSLCKIMSLLSDPRIIDSDSVVLHASHKKY